MKRLKTEKCLECGVRTPFPQAHYLDFHYGKKSINHASKRIDESAQDKSVGGFKSLRLQLKEARKCTK